MEAKIKIFTNLRSRDKALETFTFDLDVPKLILLGEDEAWRVRRSPTPKIFHSMTKTTILELQVWALEVRNPMLSLSFSRESRQLSLKSDENPNP